MGRLCLFGAAGIALLLLLQASGPPAATAAAAQQQQQQDDEVHVCEGRVLLSSSKKKEAEEALDLSAVSVRLLTKNGALLDSQPCSPSGLYIIPLPPEALGAPLLLQVVGPPEFVFEEETKIIQTGKCTQENNFVIKGFGISGEVVSFGTGQGVEGVPLLLQPAATATAAPATAAAAAAAVTTKRDGSFRLAMPTQGRFVLSVGTPEPPGGPPGGPSGAPPGGRLGGPSGGPSWVLSPQQILVEVDAAGRVSPSRVSFKAVAARIEGEGPAGLEATAAAVLLLPPDCPAVFAANCGALPLEAAAAAKLLAPAALAAALPGAAKGLVESSSKPSLCAAAIDRKTGKFAFPAAPLCSCWLLLSPLAIPHPQQQQQQQQQQAVQLFFSPEVQQLVPSRGVFSPEPFKARKKQDFAV
ncbi:hypothetical protein, conserved [Eimeria tenella]|uniref:NOMO-like N-terminal beta-sandwich domain-containing protein n=1 Tax=Eimeria tenella TaxID=5802 RepID=U6L580_EIMTE|nr:hypothetical protein, conserved [Eimeria tenella]CDJ44368.1 hypothetical protein, conserved [Eimeria tenella]|eukprot:XP_013235117.1 hypothetical protein, conserved [Eimeria tenella]